MTHFFYQTNAALKADAPSYIERSADQKIIDLLIQGEYCYILTPRQMGKSSLVARTKSKLTQHGITPVVIDLTQIGKDVTKEEWYLSVVTKIGRQLKLPDVKGWWNENHAFGVTDLFNRFIEEIVLPQTTTPIAIFFDEIDMMLGMNFSADFFASLRSFFNARAINPELGYERLSIVLLGVATPDELINDHLRTPFNIGEKLDLEQFDKEELALLAQGWSVDSVMQEKILDRVYDWTQGHPYLTQTVCSLLSNKPVEEQTADEIDQIVKQKFLTSEASRSESNIQFVSSRLLQDGRKNKLLTIYRKILATDKIRYVPQSPDHNALVLSGIVKQDDHGYLQVRNPIYANIFTDGWAKDNIDTNWKTRILVGTSVFLTVALLALVGTLLYDNLHIARRYSNLKNIFHEAQQTDEKRHALAEIFMLDPIYDADGYKREALNELFFRIDTQAEQMELLRLPASPDEEAIHEVEVIAQELLPTLADVDGNNANIRLLETIATSLQGIKTKQGESLPISYWVEARQARFATPPDYEKAIQAYNQALEREVDQPALLYERADTYFLQGKPEQALDDLSKMLEIAKKSSLATPTPLPTAIPTLTGTLPISATDPAITPPVATESTATIIVSTPTKIEDKRTAIPTQTATPLPTATPQPPPANEPFEAAFPTGWEMQKEIKALILRHQLKLTDSTLWQNYPLLTELTINRLKVAEKDGMRQWLVPAGEFTMGSENGGDDEKPVHTVNVEAFWIDETEVTNKMYAQCVAEGGCTSPSQTNSYTNEKYYGNPEFDAYPVIWVNWNQATAYCEWAGRRLPTEAEWEKAARGTDGRVYPWGDAFDGTKLNFCDTNCSFDWADKTADDGYADVAPVGSYPAGASPYGALDMAGNVWEWTKSKYVSYPYKDDDGRNDETGTDVRVLRGGSWNYSAFNVRAAYRNGFNPDDVINFIGFRCSQD